MQICHLTEAMHWHLKQEKMCDVTFSQRGKMLDRYQKYPKMLKLNIKKTTCWKHAHKKYNFFTQINCLISTVTLQLSHGARHKEEANHHENQNYSAQEAPAQLLNQEAMRMQVIHIQYHIQYNLYLLYRLYYTYYLK